MMPNKKKKKRKMEKLLTRVITDDVLGSVHGPSTAAKVSPAHY